MKRKLAILMVATMTLGTLFGCGSTSKKDKNDTSTASKDGVTIDFWNSWTGSDGDTLVEKVNEFNETNPYGITVNMDISSSFAEKLSTALPTGEAAPLVLLGAADRYSYQEYLLDINDIWDNTSLKEEDFNANAMSAMKIDEDLYSIPFQNSMYYLYWNKDLFKDAGLDPETPPKNYEEWAEMASKITDSDKNVYGSGLFMSYGNHEMSMMQMMSGRLVTKTDDGKWSVNIANNDGVKKYLKWMKDEYTSGNNPKDDGIETMFNAGQIGLMVNGPWHAAGAKAAGINFGMTKIFSEEPVGDVAGFFVTSSASEEEKLASERFIEWWYKGNEGTAIEDTGAGRKFQLAQVALRGLHRQVRPHLHAGGVLRCAGAGGAAAGDPAGGRHGRPVGAVDLPRADLPCDQLPLRAGCQHPPELLRRHRRRQPRGYSNQGLQLSGNAVTGKDRGVRQDRHPDPGRVRGHGGAPQRHG